jgi:hypothetical protein
MAYFIRRCGDDCSVIALHPDDREEVIASGLTIGDAEDLCVNKIEALPSAAPALPSIDAGPAVAAPEKETWRAAAGVQILGQPPVGRDRSYGERFRRVGC